MEKFDKKWWFDFIEKNCSFTEAQTYKNVISKDTINLLLKGVFEMVQTRLNRLYIYEGFRVYVDGKKLQDEVVEAKIKDNKLTKNESIESYFKRNFGDNFGIILNCGESYSDILAGELIKAVQPLFDIMGIPPLGVELTTFIGNYGWTPLGIHTDGRGENVLHFHLGPGKKRMYTWDEDVYQKEGKGIPNNNNIEPLLKYANEFEFGAGDLFFMPWNKRHVGYSGEFSIGVTMWFNNPSKFNFSKLMIESMKRLYLKNDRNIIANQLDYVNNKNTFEDFIDTLKINKETLKAPLEDFLESTYNEYKKCLLSNGGWRSIPLNQHKKTDISEAYPNLENEIIKLNKINTLNMEIINGRMSIYVRGTILSFKYFPEIAILIEDLNDGKTIDIKALLKQIDFPKEVMLYFIKLLLNNKGVILEQNIKIEQNV